MAALDPAIHGGVHGAQGVDARAMAAPKGLRPRRRAKSGQDELVGRAGMSPHLRLGLIAAAAVLILDQATKLWLLFMFDIARRGAVVVTPFFDLVLAWNTGISYGWFSESGPTGQAIMLAIKAIAVVALAIWMARSDTRTATFGLGLIIGGALGNAIDRLAYGAVVDFALFHLQIGDKVYNWYVFNLADVAIVVGVATLLYDSFLGRDAVKAP
jgi:signal peptidase II